MKSRSRAQSVLAATLAIFVATLLPFDSAEARAYKFSVKNSGRTLPAIDQPAPAYPDSGVHRGQEGWVRMSFAVTPGGRAVDPIIVNSSGGGAFEAEARKAMDQWIFEAPGSGEEAPNNLVNIRSETRHGRDGATRDFIRRYRRIMTHVQHEETAEARAQLDDAAELGGWNLYESAMLWLMAGRVAGQEGDMVAKLECYQRALAVGTRRTLQDSERQDILQKIFAMQDEFGQYAAAKRTFATLQDMLGKRRVPAEIIARMAEIDAMLETDDVIAARATIYNPCDCDGGEPLWYYRPTRRTFSFADLDGNVERFEARCDRKRIRGDVEEGASWTLAPDWGSCRLFVFGDDGASFDFLEHLEYSQDERTGEAAVARSHVLD